MDAYRLDTKVTFRRRSYISARERGEFEDYLTTWAQYTPTTRISRRGEVRVAGQEVDFEGGALRVRDSGAARTIVSADRVIVDGLDHRITSVALPINGEINIGVTTDLGET